MNDTTTSSPGPPPAPAPAPPLVRPRDDRVIAGVASGIARRLGIGAGWIRAAFVVATLFGGTGLLLYVIGWVAIPEEGETESIAAARVADVEGSSRWFGVALIAIGGLIVLSWTDVVRGEIVWAGALILVGVLLYRGELPAGRKERPPAQVAPPLPPPPPPLMPTETGVGEGEAAAVPAPGSFEAEPPRVAPPPPPPPRLRRREPRSILGRLTLATMFLAVGALALLDSAGAIEPSARHYVGAVVGVAGLGLLVGAWFGRSRGLIAVGILLLPILLITSIVRVPWSGDYGEKNYVPQAVAQVDEVYRLAAGELTIDLTQLPIPEETVAVEATVGAGSLRVLVPADAAVTVDGRVGFGEIEVFGVVRSGVGRELSTTPLSSGRADFALEVEVGFGEVRIVRGSR